MKDAENHALKEIQGYLTGDNESKTRYDEAENLLRVKVRESINKPIEDKEKFKLHKRIWIQMLIVLSRYKVPQKN